MMKCKYPQIADSLKLDKNLNFKADDIARELGISKATLYNWKAKYGGMESSDQTLKCWKKKSPILRNVR